MKENWVSFPPKKTPIFQIRRGRDFVLENYFQMLEECRKIDIECFEEFNNYDYAVLPEGLSKKWILINNDIHTFVLYEESNELAGYISGMPLKDSAFEKIKTGKITDSEIQENDIMPFTKNAELKIYIMCMATKKNVRQYRCGHFNEVTQKLFSGFFNKLIEYWENDNIKIIEFAAVAWTPQGINVCKLLGMEQIYRDRFDHPIFCLNTHKYKRLNTNYIQGIDNLINAYRNK
jgi:hypothetical protein